MSSRHWPATNAQRRRAVRTPGLFLPRPGLDAASGWCSIAPSACATPGRRSPAAVDVLHFCTAALATKHATVACPRPNPPSLGEKAGRGLARWGRAVARDDKVENRARTGASTWPVRPARPHPSACPAPGRAPQFAVPARLRDWAALEVGAGRLLPWFAVAYGIGVVLYFTAEREPAWLGGAGARRICCGNRVCGAAQQVRLSARRWPSPRAAAGFAVATLHTAWIAHPVLRRAAWNVAVSGFVESREERERNDRIVVRAHTIEGRRLDPAPQRVRVTVRTGTAPAVGSFVAFKADLLPPLAPLRPGGYDFARDMYFSRIGASGYVLGRIKTAAPPVERRRLAALRRGRRGHARWHRQAHPRRHSRRRGRDRLGADHRQARRPLRRRSRTRSTSPASPMCWRSPAFTWRW